MKSRTGMHLTRDCLVLTIRSELYDEFVEWVQKGILEKFGRSRLNGVVIDLAGVTLFDTHQARKLFDTAKMVRLFGGHTVFTGISAGIAISLVDLGVEPGEFYTAAGIEQGVALLEAVKSGTKHSRGQ